MNFHGGAFYLSDTIILENDRLFHLHFHKNDRRHFHLSMIRPSFFPKGWNEPQEHCLMIFRYFRNLLYDQNYKMARFGVNDSVLHSARREAARKYDWNEYRCYRAVPDFSNGSYPEGSGLAWNNLFPELCVLPGDQEWMIGCHDHF